MPNTNSGVAEIKTRINGILDTIDGLLGGTQTSGGTETSEEEQGGLQDVEDARTNAISDIKARSIDALGDIKLERAASLATINARSDGAVDTLSNAIANALAAIHRATAEMDRKRMGYGNPNNQDDH
jgi:hypothetical protein